MQTLRKEEIRGLLVTSKEVLEILSITRARLSQLIKKGKLQPVKKNVYLLSDVLERKKVQEGLRIKFYRPRQIK